MTIEQCIAELMVLIQRGSMPLYEKCILQSVVDELERMGEEDAGIMEKV